MTDPATKGLDLRRVSVAFAGKQVLADLNLTVARGETVALLGPSGSGKSTLLRVIAGLQEPDSGALCWDGIDLTRAPTHTRRFGMVFQDHQLFPHLDVASNIEFGLRMQRVNRHVRYERVAELLELVGLPGFERHHVGTLSGGEAQRVALARALAPTPRLLLLDEPLASLDAELRDRLAHDVRRLLHTTDTTAIHVTHDPHEAHIVADRIEYLTQLNTLR